MSNAVFPYFISGEVVKGFGRGSKQLGFPTANFSIDVVNSIPGTLENGIYYGFASVNKDVVYKMVMSVGWNPFYKNSQKSMETYIMHKFDKDFYGEMLHVCIVGYIRPERDFNSTEELIHAIECDVDEADKQLDKSEVCKYIDHDFFKA